MCLCSAFLFIWLFVCARLCVFMVVCERLCDLVVWLVVPLFVAFVFVCLFDVNLRVC